MDFLEKYMTEVDVVGIGRAPLDIVYVVDHFPAGDDLIRVEEASMQGGGPVPNALSALSHLGVSTALLDTIGDDWQGQKIREYLEDYHVNAEFMHELPSGRSTVSTILVHKTTGKRAIINYRGDSSDHRLEQNEIELISKAKILHITGTYPETVLSAAGQIRASGGKVSFDGGAGLYKEADRKILSKVNYCITAIGYAQNYTGQDSISAMLDAFLMEGVEVAGITCGTDGSWFKEAGGVEFHQPAYIMPNVVDTTGCGDIFHGVFLYGVLKDFPLEKSVRYASAAGAIAATRLGGRQSIPSLDEIVQLAVK
jgi:sulfofructose kinase